MESQRILSILCDCSGSMTGLKSTMIESINEALRHSAEHFASGLLIMFNSQNQKEVFVPDLSHFTPINPEKFDCDHCSDLYDAVGEFLTDITSGNRFPDSALHEVLIISDGSDNSSKKFNRTTIRNLIEKARESGRAEVYLMTTSGEFRQEAESLGMDPKHAIHYSFTPEGIKHAIGKGADYLLAKIAS